MTVLVLWYLLTRKIPLGEIIVLACLLGGGLSNLADRIIFNGSVTDFLNFGVGWFRTGILNVADISIFFGGAVFLFLHFRPQRIYKSKDDSEVIQ